MCCAATMMAVTGTSIKWATESLPSTVVVFFRNLLGMLILLPWLLPRDAGFRTNRLPLHAVRCLLGVGAMYCYFQALKTLPLATAVMLNFTSPLFIPLIARVWLKEPLSPVISIAAVLGLIGVAIIWHPGADFLTAGSVFALASAIFASGSLVTVRKLTSTEPASRVAFFFALGGAIATAIPLPVTWQTPTAHQWIPLLLTGACATASQILLTRGYSMLPAGQASIFQYLTVPLAILFGWAVWGEPLSWSLAAGGALIIASGVLASRNPQPQSPAGD